MRQAIKDEVARKTQQRVVDLDTKNRLCRQIVSELYDIRSLARMSDKGGFLAGDPEQARYNQIMQVLRLKLLDNIQSSPKAFADNRDDENVEDEEEGADDVARTPARGNGITTSGDASATASSSTTYSASSAAHESKSRVGARHPGLRLPLYRLPVLKGINEAFAKFEIGS
jgi:hypothetical protein